MGWVRIVIDGREDTIDGEPPTPGEQPALSAALVQAGEHLGEIRCGPRIPGTST